MPNVFSITGEARKVVREGEVGLPQEETRGGGLSRVDKKKKKKINNPLDIIKEIAPDSLKKLSY